LEAIEDLHFEAILLSREHNKSAIMLRFTLPEYLKISMEGKPLALVSVYSFDRKVEYIGERHRYIDLWDIIKYVKRPSPIEVLRRVNEYCFEKWLNELKSREKPEYIL
jgi:hypothetical protein